MSFFDNYKKIKEKQNSSFNIPKEELEDKMHMLGIFHRYSSKSGIVNFKELNSSDKSTSCKAGKVFIDIIYNMFMERIKDNSYLTDAFKFMDASEYKPFKHMTYYNDRFFLTIHDIHHHESLNLPGWFSDYFTPLYASENLNDTENLFKLNDFVTCIFSNKGTTGYDNEGPVVFLMKYDFSFTEEEISDDGIASIKNIKKDHRKSEILENLDFFKFTDFYSAAFLKKFRNIPEASKLGKCINYFIPEYNITQDSFYSLSNEKAISKQLKCVTDISDEIISKVKDFMQSSVLLKLHNPIPVHFQISAKETDTLFGLKADDIYNIGGEFAIVYSYLNCPNFVRLRNLALYLLSFTEYCGLAKGVILRQHKSDENWGVNRVEEPIDCDNIDINSFIYILLTYPFLNNLMNKDNSICMEWFADEHKNLDKAEFNENKTLLFHDDSEYQTRYRFKYNTKEHQKENLEIIRELFMDNGLLFDSINDFITDCPKTVRRIKIPWYSKNSTDNNEGNSNAVTSGYINPWYSDYEDFNIEAITSRFHFLKPYKKI